MPLTLPPKRAPQSAAMEAKLAAMRDGRVAVVSPEAKVAAEKLSLALFDEWARRRRIFRDCYDALLESVETKPAQLKADVRAPRRAGHQAESPPALRRRAWPRTRCRWRC